TARLLVSLAHDWALRGHGSAFQVGLTLVGRGPLHTSRKRRGAKSSQCPRAEDLGGGFGMTQVVGPGTGHDIYNHHSIDLRPKRDSARRAADRPVVEGLVLGSDFVVSQATQKLRQRHGLLQQYTEALGVEPLRHGNPV